MIDIDHVAEAIRNSFDEHQQRKHGRPPLTPWSELPDARKEKWYNMARAAAVLLGVDL